MKKAIISLVCVMLSVYLISTIAGAINSTTYYLAGTVVEYDAMEDTTYVVDNTGNEWGVLWTREGRTKNSDEDE